nr:hypothetical protein [Tanacetum cinerariifolium]
MYVMCLVMRRKACKYKHATHGSVINSSSGWKEYVRCKILQGNGFIVSINYSSQSETYEPAGAFLKRTNEASGVVAHILRSDPLVFISQQVSSSDTEALSTELKKARAALIPFPYQLHDHQFELQFQSHSKRILSEMISTSNSPHEDEISILTIRLHSIMANIDTTILKEEEEIKKINVLTSHKNDEVSQVRKKLEDATDLLNMKHDHMAKIQKVTNLAAKHLLEYINN